MTENEIRINETTMWREWITVRGLEPITLQDIDDRLAELKQQVKVEPEVMLQVNGIISCIQHQLNLKRRKEREGIIKATYEYSLKILDIMKKEIKDTLSA